MTVFVYVLAHLPPIGALYELKYDWANLGTVSIIEDPFVCYPAESNVIRSLKTIKHLSKSDDFNRS